MKARSFLVALVLTLGAPLPAGAQGAHPASPSQDKGPVLGTIVFPNSGTAAAQRAFLRGVALLHSFEYAKAAAAFREAQKTDPSFALPYWAEALTYSQVIWRIEDLPAARAALERLGPSPKERIAMGKTPLEILFGTAVEEFFKEGSIEERVMAYAEAMRRMVRDTRGEEPEARAFAAHAVMLEGYMQSGAVRDSAFREAIGLAQSVLTSNPNHPGATHYLIHLYDSPGMAREGLAFARAYDTIAPDAEHALHMPSHIYLQLGMWDDVARSNERAWAASRAGSNTGYEADWHAFAWLHYAYLQQGRIRAAAALVDSARMLATADGPYVDSRFVVMRLQFQQNAETWRWSTRLPPMPALSANPSDRERGFRFQAEYWAVITAGMRREAGEHAAQHAAAVDSAELARLGRPYLALADSIDAGANVSATRATNAFVVRALVARSHRNAAAELQAWRAAVAKEKEMTALVGPPDRVFAAELWMQSILHSETHTGGLTPEERALIAEARRALENVLRMCPLRSATLRILATAADMVGLRSQRDDAFARLGANYRNADPERKSLLPPAYR